MSEDIQIVQLSPSNLAVTFNKKAIAKLREGGSAAIAMNFGKKQLKLLFMRDVEFANKLGDFRRNQLAEQANRNWFQRWLVDPFKTGIKKISPVGRFRKVKQ